MLQRVICRTLVAAAVCVSTTQSWAVPVTWTGGGVTPFNWTDGLNWGGTAPVAGDSLIFDGTLGVNNTNNFPAGTNFAGISMPASAGAFILNGASINLSGDVLINRGTTTTIATPFVLQQNINYDVSPTGTFNVVQTGGISGGFKVTKTGAGILSFSSALNSFSGGLDLTAAITRTTISGNTSTSLGTGTVSMTNNSILEMRSTTSTNFNNALNLGAGGGQIHIRSNHSFNATAITGTGPLTLAPTGADNLVLTPGSFNDWNGQINVIRNGRNQFGVRLATGFVNNSLINASVDLGDATFISRQNGTNGTTVIDIGTLSSSVANSHIGASAAGTGNFIYSIGARNENSTFAGNVNNGGTPTGLRKVGTGTLTLAGTASNFSGASSVEAGKLLVNGALTNAALNMAVNGGVLGGTGSMAGSVTVNGLGTLAPGNSIGTLSTGAVVVNAGGTFEVEYDVAAGQPIDLLQVTGAVTLDPASVLTFANLNSGSAPLTLSRYVFAKYTGALSGTFGTVNALPAGYGIDYSVANEIALSTAVPEISSFLAGGAATVMVALVARRRKK